MKQVKQEEADKPGRQLGQPCEALPPFSPFLDVHLDANKVKEMQRGRKLYIPIVFTCCLPAPDTH